MIKDTDARADRVRAIVEGNFGKVISREGAKMIVEFPADLAMGMPWFGQFVPINIGQRSGSAARRVSDINGNTVVCPGDLVTQNYFRY